ncbi:hypothetical protein R1flu_009234 [Riccia fluitans]|uniref:Uncharacterized protein n=1 Tax=Riccia fluitans TaxID=41844 RepID=A0ABD1Z4H9_9MARC
MKWLTPKDECDMGFVRDEDEDEENVVPMTPSPNFVEVIIQAEEAPTAGPLSREETIRKEKGKDTIVEEEIPVEPISPPKGNTTKVNEQKETQSRKRKPDVTKTQDDRPKSRLKISKKKTFQEAGFWTDEELAAKKVEDAAAKKEVDSVLAEDSSRDQEDAEITKFRTSMELGLKMFCILEESRTLCEEEARKTLTLLYIIPFCHINIECLIVFRIF